MLSKTQISNSISTYDSLTDQNVGVAKLNFPKEIDHTLCSVLNEKMAVGRLLEVRENVRKFPERFTTASAVFDALNKVGYFCPVDLEALQIKNLFHREEEYVLLLRTLSKGTNQKSSNANDSFPPMTRTPCRVERNFLNNRTNEFNVFITPTTLINSKAKVSLYSSSYRWTSRGKRQAFMPSIIYASPAGPDVEMMGKVDAFKGNFGNVSSVSSNRGFTAEFLGKLKKDNYSYAELLDEFREQPAIQKSLHQYTTRYPRFTRSFAELKDRLVDYQRNQQESEPSSSECRRYPDGSLPYNEVVGRVWLWDALGIEIGADMKEGLSSTIELQLARTSLAAELTQRRISHPLFKEFLLQQLSFDNKSNSLTKSVTLERYQDMSEADKNEVLEKLIQKLKGPISVCVYSPSEPKIKGLTDIEVTGSDVMNAIDAVLKTRIGFSASFTDTAGKINAMADRQRKSPGTT